MVRRLLLGVLALVLLMGADPAVASRLYPIQFVVDTEAVVYLNREGELTRGDLLYVVRDGRRVGEGRVSTVNGLQANVLLESLGVTLVPGSDMLVQTGGHNRLNRPAPPQPLAEELGMTALGVEEGPAIDPLESLYFGSEAEVVTIATLGTRRRLSAPSTVSVIGRDELARMTNLRLGELLQNLPGFHTMRLSRGNQEVSIRGFNREFSNKILVMLDGQPLHREYFGNTIWDTIPVSVEELERVEIIRGPGSALYGENAFLGVVNFVTRKDRPARDDDYLRLQLDGGNAGFTAGGRLDLPVSSRGLLVSAAGEHVPAFDGNADSSFGPASQTLRVSQGVRRFFLRTAGGGPLNLTYGTARARKRIAGATGTGQTMQETELFNAVYEQDALKLRVGVDQYDENAEAGSSAALGLASANILRERRLGAEALWRDGRWGASRWTMGLQHKDSHASGGFLPQAQDRQTTSLLANGDVSLGGLVATVGLRYDSNDFERRLSPRLSLVHELDKDHSVRVSYGSAFRSPTFYELGYFNQPPPVPVDLSQVDLGTTPVPPTVTGADLVFTIRGNPALESEHIHSLEVGYRAERPNGELTVTGFANQIDRLIVPQQSDDPNCPGGFCGLNPNDPTRLLFVGNATFKNVGQANSYGLELDYRRDVNEALELLYRQSLSITKLNGSGADVPYSPRNIASLGLNYHVGALTDLRATVRYQGPFNAVQALNAPPRKEPKRTLMDLGLTRWLEHSENRLDFDVLNLLNSEQTDSPNYEPSGRIFRGSMTIYY